jgi:hypothetical protein
MKTLRNLLTQSAYAVFSVYVSTAFLIEVSQSAGWA